MFFPSVGLPLFIFRFLYRAVAAGARGCDGVVVSRVLRSTDPTQFFLHQRREIIHRRVAAGGNCAVSTLVAHTCGWSQTKTHGLRFKLWPTGHSLDIVTQWRKHFFFEMLCLVVAFFLVFFTLWECCGGAFLSPVSMCANVTTLHNRNTTTTTTTCHFEQGRVCGF